MIDRVKRKLIHILDKYIQISYSQEGEDLILKRFFQEKSTGFYVDIGAHHPQRFSNTNLFYQLGWHGINIDAMPGSMRNFAKKRPRDINIEAAVSDKKQNLTYFMFNEPALNSFDEGLSLKRHEDTNTPFFIMESKIITTQSLKDLFAQHLQYKQIVIDFMTVDVEGLDLEVLRSNDWGLYRPRMILVEVLDFNDFNNDKIVQFLLEHKYKFYAKSHLTVFFIDSIKE